MTNTTAYNAHIEWRDKKIALLTEALIDTRNAEQDLKQRLDGVPAPPNPWDYDNCDVPAGLRAWLAAYGKWYVRRHA